jgi:zinc transport system ATP-binding protein
MTEFVSCRNASFGYNGIPAVSNLNFNVCHGDYLCIFGANGSGKSTLLSGLLGLKKPQDGEIIIKEIQANEIGYVPQAIAAQKDFPASVYEIVISGRLGALGFSPFYSKADKKAANENMEKLAILPLRNKCFRELSGGQQRRVLLARALCATKKLIVLDEPSAGLDQESSQNLYSLLEKINRDDSVSIIVVSHDIEAILKYATHILSLNNKQLFFGSKEDYLKSVQNNDLSKGERQ